MKSSRCARTQTALVLCLGLAATVAFRTSAVGAITVGADQNTWIDGTTRDAVMDADGTSPVLKVSGSRGPGRARKGYIRFDLSGQPFDADAPATVVVTAASEPDWGANHQLRMFALNDGFEPAAGQLGTDWQEGALTWNNAPGNEVDGRPAGSICDEATTTFIADHYRDYDRSPAIGDRFAFTLPRLGDFIQPDKSLTVMLTISDRSGVNDFATRHHETLDGPRLSFAPGDGTRRAAPERPDADTPPDFHRPVLQDLQPIGSNPRANPMSEAEFEAYTADWRDRYAQFISDYAPDYTGSDALLEPPRDGRLPASLPLARDGAAVAEIVVDLDPDLHTPESTLGRADYPPEVAVMRHTGHIIVENAVNELKHWLDTLTGADFPVVQAPTPGERTRIYVGTHFARPHFADDIEHLGEGEALDGFAVRARGTDIFIFGATTKGTLNGVYAFVENNSDLIWAHSYSDLGTVYTVDRDLDAVWADALEVPGTIQRGWLGRFGRRRGEPSAAWMWQMRNRNNFVVHPSRAIDSAEWGSWREGGGHCIGTALPYPEKPYFPWIPDPETGELRQPERILHYHHNICLTHPDLPEQYARKMLAYFRHDRDVNPERPMHAFKLGVEDPAANRNYGLCMCERCQVPILLPDGREIPVQHAVQEGITFRTTQFYLLLEYIARELAEAFPEARLSTYTYFFAVEPPPFQTIVQPWFCPYAGVPGGQLGRQPNSRAPIFADTNALWWEYAYGWSRITDLTVLREYYGLAGRGRPFAQKVAWDLRALLPLGISRVTSESSLQDPFGQMDFWVANRLYWNPEADVDELKAYYLRRTFREGAPAMARFFEKIHEVWYTPYDQHDDFVQLGWIMSRPRMALYEHLKAALEQARHPLARANIARLVTTFEKWMRVNMESNTAHAMLRNARLGRHVPFSSFMHGDRPLPVNYITFDRADPRESANLLDGEEQPTDFNGWTFQARIQPVGETARDAFPPPGLSVGHATENGVVWAPAIAPEPQPDGSFRYSVPLKQIPESDFNPSAFSRFALGYDPDTWRQADGDQPEFALFDLQLTDPDGQPYVMPTLAKRIGTGYITRWR